MKLEKLMNISHVIEAQNKDEREFKLREKLEEISFHFALSKYKVEKKENPEYKFSEALKDYSNTKTFLLSDLYYLDVVGSEHDSKADQYVEDVYSEVDDLFKPEEENIEEVLSLIKKKARDIKKFLGLEDAAKRNSNNKKGVTNLLYYNTIDGVKNDVNGRYKDLEKEGFSEFDKCLEIHLGEFYHNDNDTLGGESLKKDFGALAEYIIDEKPEVKAVVGRSWLMNTPIPERLGFKKFGEDENLLNEYPNWIQFIDKNGDISKKRFEALIKTGELPYKVSKAYIPIEEFLNKYLPENRRGKIDLKEIDETKAEKWKKINTEVNNEKKQWDEMVNQGREFREFLDKAKSINYLLSLLKPEDKATYLNYWEEMFKKGKLWKEIRLNENKEIEKIGHEIELIRERDLYKEVQIEV